jgi:hypothetical protein
VVKAPEGDWKHPILDGEAVTKAQFDALTHTLRTMRRSGFIIMQNDSGRAQTPAEQFRRAQQVAADMLGVAVNYEDYFISNLAIEIVKTADAAANLAQFK